MQAAVTETTHVAFSVLEARDGTHRIHEGPCHRPHLLRPPALRDGWFALPLQSTRLYLLPARLVLWGYFIEKMPFLNHVILRNLAV